jgi:glycosyltransferase involved in cell wall biosynthesis
MIIGIDGNEANIEKRVGSGQYAFELISHLLKIYQKNTYYIYLKDKPLVDFPKNKNTKFFVFGPKKFWTQFALPLKLFFGPRPDVFFSPSHYAPRFSLVPTVITIFDLSYIHFPKLFRKSDLYQLKNWTAYSVKKAKAILTISQSSKNDIVKYYKIDPKKVFVTYPGYDKEFFKPVKDQEKINNVKKKYKIEGDYVFYLGTIQPRKNLVRLVQAFSLLVHSSQFTDKRKNTVNRQPSTVNLVIAGKKGWLYEEFFEKIKGREDIIYADYVEKDDLPALYSSAACFVNVSLWEGFGIPVLEAMACGCPVVVSYTSSLPEVVGNAGILVDPESIEDIAKGIVTALRYYRLDHETMKKKCLGQAQKFSWEKCARETLKVLEEIHS